MADRQFLTVVTEVGTNASVNLSKVTQLLETDKGTAFLFENGSCLKTLQDFAALDLQLSWEVVPFNPPTDLETRRRAYDNVIARVFRNDVDVRA